MIGGSKNNREIIRENAFEHKRKKLGLDLKPGLSANRPSNNWAQELSQRAPGEYSMASESKLVLDIDIKVYIDKCSQVRIFKLRIPRIFIYLFFAIKQHRGSRDVSSSVYMN